MKAAGDGLRDGFLIVDWVIKGNGKIQIESRSHGGSRNLAAYTNIREKIASHSQMRHEFSVSYQCCPRRVNSSVAEFWRREECLL